jgi:hypothetical protein
MRKFMTTAAAALFLPNAYEPAQETPPGTVSADQAWVRSVCDPASPDPSGWPRYQLGNITIAVPPEYRRGRDTGFNLRFSRGTALLTVALTRQVSAGLVEYNVPGQVVCEASYGGFPTEVVSFRRNGEYWTVARWERLNEPAERVSVQASVRTTRLADAEALRLALHTIRRAEEVQQGSVPDANAWMHSPCLGDSVDSFEWTRYDLHGIRIRVPREVKHVKVPNLDELHFRYRSATMRLRLHRDASQLFASYYTPQRTRRYCAGELSGLPADMISLGGGADFGFAARWPDADRGEWLAAVITGNRLEDVTVLRRTLFTIVFPGARIPR